MWHTPGWTVFWAPGIEQWTETQHTCCLPRGVIRAKPRSAGKAAELREGGPRRAGGFL